MKPKRIALTGGIATGKSTVAGMLAEKGALILDADRFARDAVRPQSLCWVALRDLLGPDYFGADGELDRRRLRNAIIEDREIRIRIEAILHPAIIQAMEEAWERSLKSDPHRPVIFDIPLLFEAGLEGKFDAVLLVYSPPEIQIQRLMHRDGLTLREAEETLSMQLPIVSKRQKADRILDNSGDLHVTRRQLEELWHSSFLFSPGDCEEK